MTAVIDCFQAAHSAFGIHIKSGNSAVLYGKSFFKRSLPLQQGRKHTAEHSAVADHRHTFQLMAAHLAPYLLCQKNASLKSLHAAFSPRRSSLSGFPPSAAVLFWKLLLDFCHGHPFPAAVTDLLQLSPAQKRHALAFCQNAGSLPGPA